MLRKTAGMCINTDRVAQPSTLQHTVMNAYSYNCCASCCRSQSGSVCRAHGTGYQAAVAAVEGAVQYGYREFDLRWASAALHSALHCHGHTISYLVQLWASQEVSPSNNGHWSTVGTYCNVYACTYHTSVF